MITENSDEQKQLIPRFAQYMMCIATGEGQEELSATRRRSGADTLRSEEGNQ